MPESHPRSRRTGRRHVALAVTAGLASLLDSSAIVAVGLGLALWRDGFGLGLWQVGTLSASMTCSIAVGALLGGRLADLRGRDRTFAWSLLVYAGGAATIAGATSLPALLVGVVVMGSASGADLPASLALLAEHAPAGTLGRLIASTHVTWTAGVLLTSTAGLAVSTRGTAGIRVVFAGLAVLAVVTALARITHPSLRGLRRDARRDARRERSTAIGRRGAPTLRQMLADRAFVAPLVLTGCFYALYTLVANTFGSFRTYFLVTVSGATQTTATAIIAATGLLGLVGTVAFAVLADTSWRRRLFPVGMATYAVALALLSITGGAVVQVVVLALVLQNLAFPFVGDALYKVWTQEAFAPEVRATAQGTTIALARGLSAALAFLTPTLLAWNATVLFALLLVVVGLTTVVGCAVQRALRPVGRGEVGVDRST